MVMQMATLKGRIPSPAFVAVPGDPRPEGPAPEAAGGPSSAGSYLTAAADMDPFFQCRQHCFPLREPSRVVPCPPSCYQV